jgi:hypothetical protein
MVKKILCLIVILTCALLPLFSKKRIPPTPMSEYTNPDAPSYVPIPFPKNRKDIITDLKYAIDLHHGPNNKSFLAGREPYTIKIFLSLLQEKSNYKIGKILKIKAKDSGLAYNYMWTILIEDSVGQNVALCVLNADGLYCGSSAVLPYHEIGLLKSKEEVLSILSESIGMVVDKSDIKRIERITYPSSGFAGFFFPPWEIEMKDGAVYYYSIHRDEVYEVTARKKIKVRKNGHFESPKKYIPPDADDYFIDTLEDQVVILKKYKRLKK